MLQYDTQHWLDNMTFGNVHVNGREEIINSAGEKLTYSDFAFLTYNDIPLVIRINSDTHATSMYSRVLRQLKNGIGNMTKANADAVVVSDSHGRYDTHDVEHTIAHRFEATDSNDMLLLNQRYPGDRRLSTCNNVRREDVRTTVLQRISVSYTRFEKIVVKEFGLDPTTPLWYTLVSLYLCLLVALLM
jgi:hypothetical protein